MENVGPDFKEFKKLIVEGGAEIPGDLPRSTQAEWLIGAIQSEAAGEFLDLNGVGPRILTFRGALVAS